MSWVKLDDQFPEDERVADLTDRAFRLHVIALCYCGRRLTDGHLNSRAVSVVCAILTPTRTNRWVKELVDAGLWIDRGDGGYEIRNYLKFNPSRAWVEKERAAARERKRKSGSGGGSAEPSPERSGERSASPSRPVLKTSSLDVEDDPVTTNLHALRLFNAVRSRHQSEPLKALCLAASRFLTTADFEGIREYMLSHRGEIKHDGKYVAASLKNAKERGAVA